MYLKSFVKSYFWPQSKQFAMGYMDVLFPVVFSQYLYGILFGEPDPGNHEGIVFNF